jgi:hypothetical protein
MRFDIHGSSTSQVGKCSVRQGKETTMKRTAQIATALIAVALASSAGASERQVGSWTVVETTDPIMKQPRAIAVINNTSDGTALRIGCWRGRAYMAVWTHRHRYFEGDRVAVVYRIDDDDPMISE